MYLPGKGVAGPIVRVADRNNLLKHPAQQIGKHGFLGAAYFDLERAGIAQVLAELIDPQLLW